MNTANLQLEGLYLALAAIMSALKERNLLSEAELDAALAAAETAAGRGTGRASSLSSANADAVRFPIRFLRLANRSALDQLSFAEFASAIGRSKAPAGEAENL